MKNTTHRLTGHCAAAALSIGILAATAQADEIDILIGTTNYVPFSTSLTAGTAVYLNADSNPALTDIRSTQRSLGYREVEYKGAFSASLAFTQVAPTATPGFLTYDYSAQGTALDLVGFWKGKDLPIIIGPDGHAYITDGHHTTAGYLAAVTPLPREIIPGLGHVVTGHVVQNLYTGPATPPDDAWWLARQSANNAFLYGPNGNQLTQPTDPGYGVATQPILPSTLAMATVPGVAGMTNDKYRGLTWGMADGIVKSSTTAASVRIPGYKKGNPATPGIDINFVEFYWADFLRNRITWDDTATGHALGSGQSDANLISAPLSFYAAVANGTALARSEVYADQYGRTLNDYDTAAYAGNTQTWAHASKVNGTAGATDTYRMYLLDNSTVTGDITPSFLSRANNQLHIDTTAGQSIGGVIANFGSVDINKGGSISTQWKDATLNNATYNSTMTIAAGNGTVTFTGVNTYAGATNVGAGTLKLDGAGSIANSVLINVSSGATFDVSTTAATFALGAGKGLKNNGTVNGPVEAFGTISGGGIFNGVVTLESGAHIAPGNSPGVETFAAGLTLMDGALLDFELGTLSDEILITGGTLTGSGTGQTFVNFLFGAGFVPDTYTLLDWTGATPAGLEASDFAVGSMPPSSSASFEIVGNTLRANVVPEPGALGLLGMGALTLLRRRRK